MLKIQLCGHLAIQETLPKSHQTSATTFRYSPKILTTWILQWYMDKIYSMMGIWLNFHLNSNIQPSDLLLLF
jgi:hypothetical protein